MQSHVLFPHPDEWQSPFSTAYAKSYRGYKGLIKDLLRELLHKDPTLFRAGRANATEPATERAENTGKFSRLVSWVPSHHLSVRELVGSRFSSAFTATWIMWAGTAEAEPPRTVAGRGSVGSGGSQFGPGLPWSLFFPCRGRSG